MYSRLDKERRMKYLVTGCLGFIGSYFVKYLLENYNNITVIGINRNSNQKNLKRLESVLSDNRFTLYYADFSRDDLTDAFQDVDYVVHFGAKTFVDYSIRDPQPFIESNIVGTYRILEEARKCPTLKKYLQFSTDEVYGSILKGSYKEDSPLNPTNPYSATKATGDMLAISYYNTYNIPIVISRTENVYGPYQGKEKVVPTFVKKALSNEPLPIYGDGSHIRQWCHIEDAVRGALFLLENGRPGKIYHIAGNQELNNLDLAKKILKTLNKPKNLISFITDKDIRPGHDKRYALDSTKIRNLGWKPLWTLETGLEDVINWYKENLWWIK